MSGVRRRVTVIGPGAKGCLRVSCRLDSDEYCVDVPMEKIPASLRMPNSTFVGLLAGQELVRVEPVGEQWLEIQRQVREVLNHDWDPIGVAEIVCDEYDSYIEELYRLIKSNAPDEEVASRLRSIEVEEMKFRASSTTRLRLVAARLRELRLPDVDLT